MGPVRVRETGARWELSPGSVAGGRMMMQLAGGASADGTVPSELKTRCGTYFIQEDVCELSLKKMWGIHSSQCFKIVTLTFT